MQQLVLGVAVLACLCLLLSRAAGKAGIAHLTKICMPPRRRRTRWRVDSFWML